MILRWLLWIIAGLLLGGIVHLGAVLVLPNTATQDAYSRLTPIAPVNAVAAVPAPTPQSAVIPFLDPAFATAVCRYDLGKNSLAQGRPLGYDAAGNLYAYLYIVDADLHTAGIELVKFGPDGRRLGTIDLENFNDQFCTTLRVLKEDVVLAVRNLQDRTEVVALAFGAAKR